MNLIPNLNIDILSGRLKTQAKKWRWLLVISVILFAVYTFLFSRFIEYKTISIVIYFIIIVLIIFFAATYKYFIEKYEVIGVIVLNPEKIKIKTKTETKYIEVNNIKELRFEFTGYYDQPFKYGSKLRTENGNKNYFIILTEKTNLTYELFLKSGKMLKALENYLDYYANRDIKTFIQKI